MKDEIESFEYFKANLVCDDISAAILVLAESVKNSATFNRYNAELFGHELALAMKNVFNESQIRIVQE